MPCTRKERELADEVVRLRKITVNAKLRVEEALRMLPSEPSPLRRKLENALAALEAASPSKAWANPN